MDSDYTKEECLIWIKHPDKDPNTETSLTENKRQFKKLLDSCKKQLSKEDVIKYNHSMLPIIFPTREISDIRYDIVKLDESYGELYDRTMYSDYPSEKEIKKSMDDDNFIIQVLKSERNFIAEKFKSSQDCPQQFRDRLKVLNDGESTFTSDLISSKRSQLMEILKITEGLLGTKREHIKKIIYQYILNFSYDWKIPTNFRIIGSYGTGKYTITKIFAELYFSLGIIYSNDIKNIISPNNIGHMICLKDPQNLQIIYDFMGKYNGLCPMFILNSHMIKDSNSFRMNTLYLTDYDANDLLQILFSKIGKTLLSEQNTSHITNLIKTNMHLFVKQADDMMTLARYITCDSLLVSLNSKYDIQYLNVTLSKFFLQRNLYTIFFDDNKLQLLPYTGYIPAISDILCHNLINREQFKQLLGNDQFIIDIINSKKHLLEHKMIHYHKFKVFKTYVDIIQKSINQLGEPNIINVVRDIISKICDDIELIVGESRENIRRFFYSYIYLFSRLPSLKLNNFMNFMIIGSQCDNKNQVINVIANICSKINIIIGHGEGISSILHQPTDMVQMIEYINIFETQSVIKVSNDIFDYYDGMCCSVISCDKMEDMKDLYMTYPNQLFLLPYTSNDLFASLDLNNLNKEQQDTIKHIIDALNNSATLNSQLCDMYQLSWIIRDDLLMYKQQYDSKKILNSFKKFFYNKGCFINFSDDIENYQHTSMKVFDDAKRLKRKYYT